MSTVIPFPAQPERSLLDWKEIEKDRKRNFPRIPKKAVILLKALIEARSFDRQRNYLGIYNSEDYEIPAL